MLKETSSYDELYRTFRWDIPAQFNIATACCDRHADGTGRLALIYVDEDGTAQRTSFDELKRLSCRFANVLKAGGTSRAAPGPRRAGELYLSWTMRPSRIVTRRSMRAAR